MGQKYHCQYSIKTELDFQFWFFTEHLSSDEYAGLQPPQGEKKCLRCGRMYDHEADSSEEGP